MASLRQLIKRFDLGPFYIKNVSSIGLVSYNFDSLSLDFSIILLLVSSSGLIRLIAKQHCISPQWALGQVGFKIMQCVRYLRAFKKFSSPPTEYSISAYFKLIQ